MLYRRHENIVPLNYRDNKIITKNFITNFLKSPYFHLTLISYLKVCSVFQNLYKPQKLACLKWKAYFVATVDMLRVWC